TTFANCSPPCSFNAIALQVNAVVDNPDYYLRYNKSFNRMGGQMRYVTADNRDFLLAIVRELRE
ncbi:MAG TPA: hypothetical protein PLV73_12360, partial [Treponemataceae bacterium]|nr:hypothetical protein [Treponemataceae bacterium]HPG69074.1 hypothetical protein [Candidatus Hydrogenedentota bacterium]